MRTKHEDYAMYKKDGSINTQTSVGRVEATNYYIYSEEIEPINGCDFPIHGQLYNNRVFEVVQKCRMELRASAMAVYGD